MPAEIDPVAQTLDDQLSASVSRYPKEVALEFFGRQTPYAELGERVERVANGLRKQGVVAGARVALVYALTQVLATGLNLLGMKAPPQL